MSQFKQAAVRCVVWLITYNLLNATGAYGVTQSPGQVPSGVKLDRQVVRAKLSGLASSLTIKGTDLALSLVKDPELGLVKADEWLVDCRHGFVIQPENGRARRIPPTGILIESMSGILSLNEHRFREKLVIYPKEVLAAAAQGRNTTQACLVVNHLQVENYLESVVNGEFNSQWAEAAVEAQVIAARTYAVYQMQEMRKNKASLYDVESTQKDQVYLGMDRADFKGSQIVAKTKGIILIDPRSKTPKPIKAFYHAACGGNTILPQEVWGNAFAGFSKKVRCPFCVTAPSYHWEYRLSFNEMEEKLHSALLSDPHLFFYWPKEYTQHFNEWILMSVKTVATAHASDPRVQDFVFEFAHQDHFKRRLMTKMNAYQVRNWLDATKLKSTLFTLSQQGRSVIFEGKGSGHGVGMCQWGAKKMGEKGYSRENILSFYYPGVKTNRIW